jgi:hypothetical protein
MENQSGFLPIRTFLSAVHLCLPVFISGSKRGLSTPARLGGLRDIEKGENLAGRQSRGSDSG